MAILKCKMCDANLNPKEGETICECEYCGTKQTISTSSDSKVLKSIARATLLRNKNEFDNALAMLNPLVCDDLADAEVYWNIVLCKYGITYVDDYDGSKKPTVNRLSNVSILEDEDYRKCISLADGVAFEQYESEARVIADIQKHILKISNSEDPYDIFISYKESDEFGDRTPDSVIAQDIYNLLTKEGYRVFLSRVSLSSVAGQEYEPYIYSALYSAKLMILVGTDAEYVNSVWVKNEWSRFLSMMDKNSSKKLIPCFKDMGAYDLPREIQGFQGIDLAKLGAEQDLLIGVNKILKKHTEVRQVKTTFDFEKKYKRAFNLLESENYDEAIKIANEILNENPDDIQGYIITVVCDAETPIDKVGGYIKFDFNDPNFKHLVELVNDDNNEFINGIYKRNKESILDTFDKGYSKYLSDGISESLLFPNLFNLGKGNKLFDVESTGKELLAKCLDNNDAYKKEPFLMSDKNLISMNEQTITNNKIDTNVVDTHDKINIQYIRVIDIQDDSIEIFSNAGTYGSYAEHLLIKRSDFDPFNDKQFDLFKDVLPKAIKYLCGDTVLFMPLEEYKKTVFVNLLKKDEYNNNTFIKSYFEQVNSGALYKLVLGDPTDSCISYLSGEFQVYEMDNTNLRKVKLSYIKEIKIDNDSCAFIDRYDHPYISFNFPKILPNLYMEKLRNIIQTMIVDSHNTIKVTGNSKYINDIYKEAKYVKKVRTKNKIIYGIPYYLMVLAIIGAVGALVAHFGFDVISEKQCYIIAGICAGVALIFYLIRKLIAKARKKKIKKTK